MDLTTDIHKSDYVFRIRENCVFRQLKEAVKVVNDASRMIKQPPEICFHKLIQCKKYHQSAMHAMNFTKIFLLRKFQHGDVDVYCNIRLQNTSVKKIRRRISNTIRFYVHIKMCIYI